MSGDVLQDPYSMTMSQFLNFAKGTGLADKKMTISDFDRIFMRAVRAPAASDMLWGVVKDMSAVAKAASAFKGAAVSFPVGKGGDAKKGSNLMKQHHFVGALVRLAILKFPGSSSLGEALTSLVEVYLQKHVYEELQLLSDAFSEVMESKLMQAVLRKHSDGLQSVFGFYAAEDQGVEALTAQDTMNVSELSELCEDAGLIDNQFGVREMIAIFVKVNIEDELYEVDEDDEDAEHDGDSSELCFAEFEELIARIFNAREWVHVPESARQTNIENAFDGWLGSVFLPQAKAAIKRRKKGTQG